MIQILSIAAVTLISAVATAQPEPPYTIYFTGQLQQCSPSGGNVWLESIQNNTVTVSVQSYVDPNCSFTDSMVVDNASGIITVMYPCNGALDTLSQYYTVGFLGYVTIDFYLPCGSANVDCTGITNGPNVPGSPCDDNNADTENDTWGLDCQCVGTPVTVGDCAADFWALQGYTFGPGNDPNTIDSTVVLPIPNEIWVWNMSTSSTSAMTFLWSFGDGTSSTDAYPTHIYDGTGPYELCLTIVDASGCSDTYCQTITVDGDGILSGFAGDNGSRSVITLNVIAEQPLGVTNAQFQSEISMWPNPVQNSINMSITSRSKNQVIMSITDMNGKMVSQTKSTLRNGKNQIQMDVASLQPGMYIIQVGSGAQTTTKRFVKL